MDSSYRCVECETWRHSTEGDDLPWKETSVARTDANGQANRKARVLAQSRSLRDQLLRKWQQDNAPIWVAVENRGEEDEDSYWIGKATKVVKRYESAGSVGRVRYDVGDLEIAVEWFHRDVGAGGDERRVFKRWVRNDALTPPDPGPLAGQVYSFNSTELRAINVAMQPVAGIGGPALEVVRREVLPRPRRVTQVPARLGTYAQNGIAYRARQQRAEPPEQLWEIPAGDEDLILRRCGGESEV